MVADASRTSPERAAAMKVMSAVAATVTGPKLLHAQANAVSASAKIRPPCAMACPLVMSSRTIIRARAQPRPCSTTSMPSAAEARSAAIMAATGSASGVGSAIGRTLLTDHPVSNWLGWLFALLLQLAQGDQFLRHDVQPLGDLVEVTLGRGACFLFLDLHS